MASELDIAMALTGRRRAEDGSYGRELSTTIVGVATSDSSDGSVRVDLGGESVTQDDVQEVEVPTTVEVREGDQVRVTLDGVPGSGRRPTVTGVVGGGDRTRIDVDNAVSDASQAVDTAGRAEDTAQDAKSTATDAQSKAQDAQEQVLDVSARIGEGSVDITATIETRLAQVRQDVDATGDDVSDLSSRLSDEIRTRQSFMRFSEESSDPTLTLGQTDSPAQVKLTNKQLQFLYMSAVVAYISGDALLIRNATILQQLVLGGFAFVPRENGNLALKWVG
jgi:hypothetical protein